MAGELIVAGSMLQKLEMKLAMFVNLLPRGRVQQDKLAPRLQKLLAQLRQTLPPNLPPLPAFEVEGE
jgi:hypothetical protein